MKLALRAACAVTPFLTAATFTAAQPTFNDVPFAVVPRDAGGTITLLMDIYAPTAGAPPFPLLIWVHGGGWSGGTPDTVPASALALRSRGFVVASIGYRLI